MRLTEFLNHRHRWQMKASIPTVVAADGRVLGNTTLEECAGCGFIRTTEFWSDRDPVVKESKREPTSPSK